MKYESGNKKSSQKPRFFDVSSKQLTQRLFEQPGGHMNNQKMLRFITRHILDAFFPVLAVVVNYRKRQNIFLKKV